MPRRPESRRPMLIALGATCVLVLAVVFGPRLWRSATADDPIPPDETAQPAAAMLEGVDMRRVHAELIPAWVVTRTSRGAPLQEERAFEALHAALAPHAELAALMTELRAHTDPVGLWQEHEQEESLSLVQRWNETLDVAGIPYMLRANLMANAEGVSFYALSYEVVERGAVRVGEAEHRVRFLRRVDRLNMREWYIGIVRDEREGVIIILDSAIELALDQIWPLLAPSDQVAARDELHAAFVDAVAEEAAQALPAEQLQVLRETAADRLAITSAIEAILDRQSCGSRFFVRTIPWNGFNEEELQPFRRARERSHGDCPEVTEDELEAIEEASGRLHRAEGLRPAVEALTAWAARPLVVHEARHAADLAQKTTALARECLWCGPTDPEAARIELSAYLAELAWTHSPAVALFQACQATAEDPGVGHGEALDVIVGRTEHLCTEGPLPRAAEVVRQLEREAFGRSDPIEWVGEYPSRVPVDNLRVGR